MAFSLHFTAPQPGEGIRGKWLKRRRERWGRCCGGWISGRGGLWMWTGLTKAGFSMAQGLMKGPMGDSFDWQLCAWTACVWAFLTVLSTRSTLVWFRVVHVSMFITDRRGHLGPFAGLEILFSTEEVHDVSPETTNLFSQNKNIFKRRHKELLNDTIWYQLI